MTRLDLFQVDAFATRVFEGNPAAVIILDAFLEPPVMQAIGAENNLAETAFCVPRSDGSYDLRWFTPTIEIAFCGHATIATAHILRTEHHLAGPFVFHTQVGLLNVAVDGETYVLDAPVGKVTPTPITKAMREAFSLPLTEAFTAGSNLYLVTENASVIADHEPDFRAILPLCDHGVGLTAAGSGPYDFTSRFFVPAEGIDEDSVTGSAHAALGPYWGARLGKTEMLARQASPRGGDLRITLKGDRVDIAGPAVTYLRGTISI